MKLVLQPMCTNRREYHIVPGPDGKLCLTMAILMAWIADMEEQRVIAGVGNQSCPVCVTQKAEFECWHGSILGYTA